MGFETDYIRKYSKSISSYCKNNLIYSYEPYEFRINGGTPNGKIVIPDKIIHLPCDVKKAIVENESVTIKDSKIISVEEIVKDNNKFIEAKINHIVTFNLRIYDKYDKIYKIICYLEKYPTPNKQSVIKEFIAVYSIVNTKILIGCDSEIVNKSNFYKSIYLNSKALIKDIQCKLCKQCKNIGCCDINCEDYINLLVGITIDSQLEVIGD